MQNQNPGIGGFSYRSLLALTWPQFMMMVLQMSIGFVDVYVAGRIGASVQAALGMVIECFFMLLIIAGTTSSGILATVGQSVGAGKFDRAQRYAGLGIMLSLGICLFLIATVYFFRQPILSLMKMPEEIQYIGLYFLSVTLLTLPAHYMLLVSGAIFRAHGKVWVPLCAIFVASVVNFFADFGLGLGYFGMPEMGYKGIAWASFFSVTTAAAFNMTVLFKLGLIGRKSLISRRWFRKGAPYLIRISIPTFAMQVFWNLGYVVLFMVTATLPHDSINAVAGLTAGLNIEAILFMPGMAFNMTAAIVVGNLLGARKAHEAKKAVARLLKIGVASMCSVAVAVWFMAPAITGIIASDEQVAAHALTYLRFNILSTPFTIFSLILNGCMVGAGATRYNLIANTGSTWLIRLPIAYLFGHILWQNSAGVFMAMLISQIFLSSSLFYVFKRKDWTRFSMIRASQRLPAPTGTGPVLGSRLEQEKTFANPANFDNN